MSAEKKGVELIAEIKGKLISRQFVSEFKALLESGDSGPLGQAEAYLGAYYQIGLTDRALIRNSFVDVLKAIAVWPIESYLKKSIGGIGKPYISETPRSDFLFKVHNPSSKVEVLLVHGAVSIIDSIERVLFQVSSTSFLNDVLINIKDRLLSVLGKDHVGAQEMQSLIVAGLKAACQYINKREYEFIWLLLEESAPRKNNQVFKLLQWFQSEDLCALPGSLRAQTRSSFDAEVQLWKDKVRSCLSPGCEAEKMVFYRRVYASLKKAQESLVKEGVAKAQDVLCKLCEEFYFFNQDHVLEAAEFAGLMKHLDGYFSVSSWGRWLSRLQPGRVFQNENVAVIHRVAAEDLESLQLVLSTQVGLSALHYAIAENYELLPDLLKVVREHCPEVLLRQDLSGYTALHAAAKNINVVQDIVFAIPQERLFDAMAIEAGSKGATPIFFAMHYSPEGESTVDVLVEAVSASGLSEQQVLELFSMPDDVGTAIIQVQGMDDVIHSSTHTYAQLYRAKARKASKAKSSVTSVFSSPMPNNWRSPKKTPLGMDSR